MSIICLLSGTMQFMAPEVIVRGIRGYSYPVSMNDNIKCAVVIEILEHGDDDKDIISTVCNLFKKR